MVIDSHVHIGGWDESNPNEAVPKTVEELVTSMDKAGIDISLIISNKLSTHREGISAEDLLREVGKFPDRLRAIVHIDFDWLEEEGYIESVEQSLRHDSTVGLKLYLGYQQFDPLDPRVLPLYEICREFGHPIVAHTGYVLEGVSNVGMDAHPSTMETLAKALPENTFVAAHFGNPWVKECGEIMGRHGNVHADLSAYFTEFQTIEEGEKDEFREDIDLLLRSGADVERLFFGTDYPLYSQSEYLETVQTLPFTADEMKGVLEGNARRVFKL